jgi:osmotically-inducible protein OsmY
MDLAERVSRALGATGYPPLRAVEVVVCDRLVTLRGRVPSYYLKQIAQVTVLAVVGVGELCNRLEVVRPGGPRRT